MKIVVDRGICAGHALCAAKAPEVYRLDDDDAAPAPEKSA